VQQRLSELLATGSLRLADGTIVGVANYAGCAQKSEFAGLAAYGYCPSKSRYYWGPAARAGRRPQEATGRLHARAGEREGVRAGA
jgi:hypothetical protein